MAVRSLATQQNNTVSGWRLAALVVLALGLVILSAIWALTERSGQHELAGYTIWVNRPAFEIWEPTGGLKVSFGAGRYERTVGIISTATLWSQPIMVGELEVD